MIRNFANTDTEPIAAGIRSRKLPAKIQQRAQRRMKLLAAAVSLDELGERPGTASTR